MMISKSVKVGIMIEVMVLVIMIFLILFNKTIPSVLSWIFGIGLFSALAGTLYEVSKKS